ncbi:hypothetical protein J6590_089627 [Homalodisca vitripennis]|nr:hypothetical protein J6590_089627 [Homalodisca vitripennis]
MLKTAMDPEKVIAWNGWKVDDPSEVWVSKWQLMREVWPSGEVKTAMFAVPRLLLLDLVLALHTPIPAFSFSVSLLVRVFQYKCNCVIETTKPHILLPTPPSLLTCKPFWVVRQDSACPVLRHYSTHYPQSIKTCAVKVVLVLTDAHGYHTTRIIVTSNFLRFLISRPGAIRTSSLATLGTPSRSNKDVLTNLSNPDQKPQGRSHKSWQPRPEEQQGHSHKPWQPRPEVTRMFSLILAPRPGATRTFSQTLATPSRSHKDVLTNLGNPAQK